MSENGKDARLLRIQAARKKLAALQSETRDDITNTRIRLLNSLRPTYEHYYMMTSASPWELVELSTPKLLYKAVVLSEDGTSFRSPFDGRTRYTLGTTTSASQGAAAYPLLRGGALYCYESIQDARHAHFPRASVAHTGGKTHILVQCLVHGRCYRGKGGLWAAEHVKPIRFVGEPFFVV